jgi:hypothetical protein
MFEWKKTIIRQRLLLKGHRASLLDSLGISDEIEIESTPERREPTLRPPSGLPTGGSQSPRRRFGRDVKLDVKLNDLIGWLHKWLEAGPTGLRSDFIRSLGSKVRLILPRGMHIEADKLETGV